MAIERKMSVGQITVSPRGAGSQKLREKGRGKSLVPNGLSPELRSRSRTKHAVAALTRVTATGSERGSLDSKLDVLARFFTIGKRSNLIIKRLRFLQNWTVQFSFWTAYW
jgi:hypothetical protein